MQTATFPVTVLEAGRADAVLSAMVEGLTRSAAQKWMEEGRVLLDGKPVKKNTPLKPGDTLLVSPPQPQDIDLVPQDIPLDIVYEDDDVVVVNKPVGMVVHPAPGHPDGTLVNALLYHCKESLSGINGERRPGIVHRIDRDTSGLLIVAKNDKAHLALAAQLQDHSLFRLYHAVVVGGFKEDSGTVNAPLARHPVDRKRMAVCRTGEGREAVTHWQVVDSQGGYSHITCRLETGRTHQIRVHMASIGHPLVGDVVYGSKKPFPGLAGQCLHAACLTFTHPTTGERMTVEAPLPDWFTNTLRRLQLT
ncbi:RluA family pseudouridine synthase [Pseudoflavonifractor capillosus]|uniref:RluA family pseudouridine synthase n=1 Tax=Pseudoflavonifractor capillosus TaxID=106588 RepID=UPI00195A5208|nr:RluA family pseudouridine synthase [Pseudoflavonifractor capillosus]MBM6897773.1 RluA family pseudouridine synthase [Pseudoflavonifractor capillosus]